MRAAMLVKKGVIEIRELPEVKTPGPDAVVIDVKACGVCGTDVHIYHGSDASCAVELPLVMGHELSGVVAAVGSNVSSILPGEKATVNPNIMCGYCHFCRSGRSAFCENHIAVGVNRPGGFAEQIVVPQQAVHTFAHADFDEAAMIEPLSCCLNVFEVMPHRLGDAYLIVGGGPIGMMMLQLAKMAGARYVAVAEIVAEKRDKCLNLGADAVLNPKSQDVAEIAEQSGIAGFDAVIDCVGLPDTQSYSLSAAGRGAKIMFFGIGDAADVLSLHPYRLFLNQNPVYSSYINPYTFERTVEIVEAGKINLKDIVASRISLDKLETALKDASLRAGGKVLVQP